MYKPVNWSCPSKWSGILLLDMSQTTLVALMSALVTSKVLKGQDISNTWVTIKVLWTHYFTNLCLDLTIKWRISLKLPDFRYFHVWTDGGEPGDLCTCSRKEKLQNFTRDIRNQDWRNAGRSRRETDDLFPLPLTLSPNFSLIPFRIVLSVFCILTTSPCYTMYLAVKYLPLPLDHAPLVGTKNLFFTTMHQEHCFGCAQ